MLQQSGQRKQILRSILQWFDCEYPPYAQVFKHLVTSWRHSLEMFLKALGGRILLEVGHRGQALLPVHSLDQCDQPLHTPATMLFPLRLTVSHQTVRQHKGFLFSVTSCRVCVRNNYKRSSATCSVPNDGPDSAPAGQLRSEIIPQTGLRILKSLSSTVLNPFLSALYIKPLWGICSLIKDWRRLRTFKAEKDKKA